MYTLSLLILCLSGIKLKKSEKIDDWGIQSEELSKIRQDFDVGPNILPFE